VCNKLAHHTGPTRHIHTTGDKHLVLGWLQTDGAVVIQFSVNQLYAIGIVLLDGIHTMRGDLKGPKQFRNDLVRQTGIVRPRVFGGQIHQGIMGRTFDLNLLNGRIGVCGGVAQNHGGAGRVMPGDNLLEILGGFNARIQLDPLLDHTVEPGGAGGVEGDSVANIVKAVRIHEGIFEEKAQPVVGEEPEKLEGGDGVMGAEVDAAGLINKEVIPGYSVGLAVVVGVFVEPAGKQEEVAVSNTVGGGSIAENAAAIHHKGCQCGVLSRFCAPLMEEMGRNDNHIHGGRILSGGKNMGRKESIGLRMELAKSWWDSTMILGA